VAEHYGPSELILSAAGGVDPERSCAWPRPPSGILMATPRASLSPRPSRAGRSAWSKDLEQAHFTLALEAPGYRSDDIHTAQIYATALGGGMSSRLFQEIRERRGLCYTIYARSAPSTIPAC
jgi:predicted Zn-dependent peptidase